MEQEAGVDLDGEFPRGVPYFMREIIEQISVRRGAASTSTSNRASAPGSASPTTGRWSPAPGSGRAVLGERPPCRASATWGTCTRRRWGKLELDMMGSHQMTERQVLDAIVAEAIRDVFEEYVDRHGLDEIAEIFAKGVKIEVGDLLPSAHYAERLKRVPPAWDKAFEVNAAERPGAVRASCVEFVLAGLYAPRRFPTN
jgi:magnesium chelatase subunit I